MFLHEVAVAFQEVEERKIKSLSVSMPPRAGKSYITSLFCAWTLGRNPTESIMRNTCTATLYAKFSYDVRAIVRGEKFMQVFPNVRISEDKGNLMGWNTTSSKQVGYFGAGVGGTIIGFGASKLAITDDLYTGLEQALSDTANDKILMWKEGTHDSRFESGCTRIDIGTRWSINDLIGRNIKEGIYEKSIIVPAMTEDDKSFCESVMTTEEYLEKRKRTESSIWLAEYMQEPVDSKGRLFNHLKIMEEAEFNQILNANKSDETPNGYEGSVAYIDVADQGTDYTAMAQAVIIKGQLFITDYVFSRDNTDMTLPICSGIIQKWNTKFIRVESNNMGAMFARHLQRMNENCKVLQVANTSNKITRILMQSVFIQDKMIFVKKDNKECLQFIENVMTFSKEGKNKNDDAPDCLSGLSIFVQSMFKNLS
jgi:predicted phage terminase large subunit-like protein